MVRRALSLAIAGSALGLSFWLSPATGPYAIFALPFFIMPVIAAMMTVRGELMRNAAVPSHPTARALEVIALGAVAAPCLGFALMFCPLGSGNSVDTLCGLAGAREAGNAIGTWAHIWGPAQLVVIVLLARRGAALAALPWYQAAATVLTAMMAPLLAVVAASATWSEIGKGGAGTAVLVPLAVATGSTVATWTGGRFFAMASALRRLVGLALILGVGLFALLWKEPVRDVCTTFWTTATWKLMSVHEMGWGLVLLAGALLLTRDPAIDRA